MRRILARLGQDAQWTHGAAEAVTVRGVYAAPYAVSPLAQVGVASSDPTFAAMSADLQGVARGDALAIGAVVYTVVRIEPDPVSGVVMLGLELQ